MKTKKELKNHGDEKLKYLKIMNFKTQEQILYENVLCLAYQMEITISSPSLPKRVNKGGRNKRLFHYFFPLDIYSSAIFKLVNG